MSDLFAENMSCLQPRWPALAARLAATPVDTLQVELVEGEQSTLQVEGIQLSSRHDRFAEAQTQVATLPEAAAEVHLYGVALGEVIPLLLARPGLQRLHVHLLNEALFALLLRLIPMPWLAEPRVQLALAAEHKEIQLPFLALPAELQLASDLNSRIRDRLVAEIHLPYVNQRFNPDDAIHRDRLQANQPYYCQDRDVSELFDRHAGREILLLAPGPTLARHYPRLRALCQQPDRPVLLCVDTAYQPLRRAGIQPDYVVSIDYNIHQGILPAEESEAVTLIYFPMIPEAVIAGWQGPRYAACSASPLYHAVQQQCRHSTLFAQGSVVHPAVDLAVKMGAGRVTLLGTDFAFIGEETHAGWPAGLLTPTNMPTHWVLNGHGQRVTTLLNFRSYLCDLERFIARHPEVPFFNTCRDGARIDGADYDEAWCQEAQA